MEHQANVLSDEVLLSLCGLTRRPAEPVEDALEALRAAERLVRQSWLHYTSAEHCPRVVTLVAAALGQVARITLRELPFACDEQMLHMHDWVKLDQVKAAVVQLVGLIRPDDSPTGLAREVAIASDMAVQMAWLHKTRFDGWHPGLPSGGGWMDVVRVTPYGLARALSPGRSTHARFTRPVQAETPMEPSPWAIPAQNTDHQAGAFENVEAPKAEASSSSPVHTAVVCAPEDATARIGDIHIHNHNQIILRPPIFTGHPTDDPPPQAVNNGHAEQHAPDAPTCDADPKPKKGRGRPDLTDQQCRHRLDVLVKWTRAHEAGLTREQFVEDWNRKNLTQISVEALESYQSWHRNRIKCPK